ncbi:unnamed protein product [Leptosia nina]|uniref:Uncharacterized protein n=1 Tax=Leptosia nina TaxID=320188 RepID=A0AAV1K5H1_9NEOP
MSSQIALVLCLLVATAVAIPATGYAQVQAGAAVNTWIPPWVPQFPWMPQWKPCTTVGASCLDCNTKLVCTKIGGLEKPCTDPTMPYCNLGECSATPSAECAPEVPVEPEIQAVPA